jgi:predicted transposase/invertase (TIGR01784 family)
MWGIFFGHGNEPEHRGLLKKMIAAKGEIRMASELLASISKDERERAHYRSRKMFRMDLEHGLAASRKEGLQEGLSKGLQEGLNKGLKEGLNKGLKEGRNEGRNEKSREIALNLLNMGVPAPTVADATGLSPAELEALKAGN